LRFAEDLKEHGTIEGQPRLEGRNAHVIFSPVKVAHPAPVKDAKPKDPSASPEIN
jgi:translation initiation factor IF-3